MRWSRIRSVLGLAACGIVAVCAAAALGAGCRNACADLCLETAEYAEECGSAVSAAEVETWVSEQSAQSTHDQRKACREYGQDEVLRAQWSCEDLAIYWEPDE